MNSLLASIEIGTVFLDTDLKIKRFTPAIRKIFNLIPEDVGRPLSDIVSKIPYSNITQDAREVLDTLNRKEVEVQTEDGSRFSLRILPYRTTENIIDGVVLTFIDISRLRKAEGDTFTAKKASILETDIISVFREPVLVLDNDMKVKSVNKAFCETFGNSAEDVKNRKFYKLHDGRWEISDLKQALEGIMEKKSSFRGLKVEQDFPGVGHKAFLLNARVIESEEDKNFLIVAMEDITEKEKNK